MTEILLWPFAAGVALTLIHAWLGVHVLARGVVFVDLSLAQVAALGLTVAILAGHQVQSDAAYWYALSFALTGAVFFAAVRAHERTIQQEAVIGIVYAVSASLGVIALDRAPQGAEHIKQLLIGSILTVTADEVATVGALYATIGLVHLLCRRALVAVSFEPQHAGMSGQRLFLWDVVFYGSFAVVVTSSVRIAGVLLVFAYLIVPAAVAGLFTGDLRRRLVLAWALGLVVTAAGLGASWLWDVPTGPAIVTAFGVVAALVALGFAAKHLTVQRGGKIASGACALVGLFLVVFPRMDQPWLDALENAMPAVQTTFLSEFDRATRANTLESLNRGRAELARLRALEQDVRWGTQKMDAEKLERLRQYLAGRSELVAGDELVLRHLREKARGRQRWLLGMPLLVAGAAGFLMLHRRERRVRSAHRTVHLPRA